jgi:hypothetical protein
MVSTTVYTGQASEACGLQIYAARGWRELLAAGAPDPLRVNDFDNFIS